MSEITLPNVKEMLDELRPSWKGWIHTVAFPISIVLGIVLLVLSRNAREVSGSAIFMAASAILFGVSALYHRRRWAVRARAILRRLDHANIFLMIAGTYTPLTLILLPKGKAIVLLACVWTGAVVGMIFSLAWNRAPRWLYVPLYVLLGWVAVFFAGDFFRANALSMWLVIAGGICYSIGALIYGVKRPNPLPRHFGFHEIFHALTACAFLFHWFAVLNVMV